MDVALKSPLTTPQKTKNYSARGSINSNPMKTQYQTDTNNLGALFLHISGRERAARLDVTVKQHEPIVYNVKIVTLTSMSL